VLTSALVGTVKDEQGAVLTGAVVRVSSPALIGGPATITTNDRGQFRFPILPPATYVLEIELPGFATYAEADVRIGVGATLERSVVLNVAGIAQSIVVQGSGSRLEARSSGFETRFGPEYLKTIPSRRFSMFDAIRAAPGVSPTSPSSGTATTVSAFGSGGNENLFTIDGTNFTCPCAGVSRAEPSVDIIQEVQVQSVGVSAEYGNIQGTVFNVVTKQGSNRFLFDASYYAQTDGLTAQPVLLPVKETQSDSGYQRASYRDLTTNLGGPLRRDRVWFFGGYQYLRDYDSQPGTNPKYPRRYEQDKIFAKLTWRFTPGLQLMQSFHEEFWVNPQIPTVVTPFEATTRSHARVPAVTFGHLTHTLSADTFWDVRVGRFRYLRTDDANSGDETSPNRFNRLTGVNSGNPQLIGNSMLVRTTAKATLTHYQRQLLSGDHEWKIGTQIEKGEHNQTQLIPTGVRFIDNGDQRFQAISAPASTAGGQFITVAAFVSDALTIGDRLTINAGLRFDRSRAISQDLDAVDPQGRSTTKTIRGLGTLYTWNVLSPRFGVTAKVTADGRTILRGSYGRFNQGVLTGEISPIHPGVTPITTMEFDATTGGYTRVVSVIDPKVNLLLDPRTRTPRTEEYSISVDRELGSGLTVTAAYVHKDGANFIAWTDVSGQYSQQTHTLPDGRTVPVFVLTSTTGSRRFLLTNPDGYSLTYNGLAVVMEKRRSKGWHALGSYTFSRTYGLQASSGATAADPQVSTVAPAFPTATFGQDPNNLTNAYGRLPNDRPHMFRVMGTIDVPRTGFTVSANFQHFSGKPWAESAQVKLPQGDQRILLEPRGSRRLSSQSLLDLRVSRSIPFGRARHAEILVDVLNVLNDTAEESLATDNVFSPNSGRPSIFIDPRRAMIGMRLNLGRP
jgi:hypothetical protein